MEAHRAGLAAVALVVILAQILVVPAAAKPLKPAGCVVARPVTPPPLPAKPVVPE